MDKGGQRDGSFVQMKNHPKRKKGMVKEIMKIFSLIIVFLGFLKTFYYSLFEIKEKNNKSGGIATLFLAILRTHYSVCCSHIL